MRDWVNSNPKQLIFCPRQVTGKIWSVGPTIRLLEQLLAGTLITSACVSVGDEARVNMMDVFSAVLASVETYVRRTVFASSISRRAFLQGGSTRM